MELPQKFTVSILRQTDLKIHKYDSKESSTNFNLGRKYTHIRMTVLRMRGGIMSTFSSLLWLTKADGSGHWRGVVSL